MQVILTREEKRKVRRFIRRAVKSLTVAGIVALIVTIIILCGRVETRYNIEAEITDIDGYTYTAEDITGHEWKFDDDRLFPEGTKVKLKMHNSLTDNDRADDEILEVKPIK